MNPEICPSSSKIKFSASGRYFSFIVFFCEAQNEVGIKKWAMTEASYQILTISSRSVFLQLRINLSTFLYVLDHSINFHLFFGSTCCFPGISNIYWFPLVENHFTGFLFVKASFTCETKNAFIKSNTLTSRNLRNLCKPMSMKTVYKKFRKTQVIYMVKIV